MGQEGTGTSAHEQLAAIASLGSVLDQRGIDYWLFGGWAVDFWVGGVTREHEDIDIAAWRADYDAIGSALRGAGWQHTPVADEVLGTRYQWQNAQVEFTFLVADDAGRVLVPVPEHPIVVSREPLGDVRRELDGVSCRTMALDLLIAGKSTPRDGVTESAKDRADFAALSRLTR